MKWEVTNMDTFLQAREYVDTVFIPLVPIAANGQMKSIVSMGEFISIMTNELERQFQGRALLIPPFTYLKSEKEETRKIRLQAWINELKEEGFQHVIFFTSDSDWKLSERELEGELVWIPTIPLEHMEFANKQQVIAEQIKQLVPILTNAWQATK